MLVGKLEHAAVENVLDKYSSKLSKLWSIHGTCNYYMKSNNNVMSHYAIEVFVHYFRQRKFPPKQRYLANRSLDCIEQTNEQCKKKTPTIQRAKNIEYKWKNKKTQRQWTCIENKNSFALFLSPYFAIFSLIQPSTVACNVCMNVANEWIEGSKKKKSRNVKHNFFLFGGNNTICARTRDVYAI